MTTVNKNWLQYGASYYELGSMSFPEGVKLVDVAHSLARTKRFRGHGESLSVARHSICVSNLCDADSWAALYALLHDGHETVIGDIAAPIKAYLTEATTDELEEIAYQVDAAIHELAGVPWPMPYAYYDIIDKADKILLVTEGRDCLPTCERPWGIEGIEPSHMVLDGREHGSWEDAQDWLDRYYTIANHLGIKPLR